MSARETVIVTPTFGYDDDGEPRPDGTPFPLTPKFVAPGNTLREFGVGGDLEQADFTVFLELTDRGKVKDDYRIEVRDKDCFARVQDWVSPRTGRGVVAVLATSGTGRSK
ncbi:hypothetical protein [Mycobacteroides abscessus]|uniref:hypothetical protein n=1 Tax=Mycobacteroides abscessus TaxID=36809 RepID=UPI0009A68482|nr:hypothetical protein [Mycobacteroides abscessus]MDB2211827.1 hypothetical protein [Mycobacteroides abscessus subsp. massiliense]MDB2235323.1 hypothetical protein [Mycobacteroides abscessus subsp. massiliense]WJJ56053.1 head-to-tail stopper [Mycobacterium phage prophiT36-2b]SKO29078.1 Uncharacterised protein [Mycobacteroides abscessus subsp. massiliense]